MAKKRGRRFQRGTDDLEQLEGIEKAQEDVRKGKRKKKIDCIDKSTRRVKNRLKRVKDREDANREFGVQMKRSTDALEAKHDKLFELALRLRDRRSLSGALEILGWLAKEDPRDAAVFGM